MEVVVICGEWNANGLAGIYQGLWYIVGRAGPNEFAALYSNYL